jgi:hypothetical protein
MTSTGNALPLVLAGPLLRRSSPQQLVLWLAVREPVRARITIDPGEVPALDRLVAPGQPGCRCVTAGAHLHYLLVGLRLAEPLPRDRWISYAVRLQSLAAREGRCLHCADAAPDLCYPEKTSPGFLLPSRVGSLPHGSCRKPHHAGGDGLFEADRLLNRCLEQGAPPTGRETAEAVAPDERPAWPSAWVPTGDQVYADAVAGPMLHAIHQVAALLVSPTPIFGVKLIGTIQRIFTWLGQPLLVDAENWMAHPGAAYAIPNIFRHPKTPQHFVVLSGDVRCSFVYDVELRGRVHGPDIWQIFSSAVREEFPPRLLDVLDRANRWLHSPRSPLNWLTRRRMRVIPRKPEGTPHGRRLLDGSGIGLVELDEQGVPWRIRELLTDGRMVTFHPLSGSASTVGTCPDQTAGTRGATASLVSRPVPPHQCGTSQSRLPNQWGTSHSARNAASRSQSSRPGGASSPVTGLGLLQNTQGCR